MVNETFPTIEHDVDSDSFYVRMSPKAAYKTRHVTVHVVAEADEEGFLVGLKILEIGAHVPYIFLQHTYGLTVSEAEKIKTLLAYN